MEVMWSCGKTNLSIIKGTSALCDINKGWFPEQHFLEHTFCKVGESQCKEWAPLSSGSLSFRKHQ